MKIHESGENYLETILMLQKKTGFVRSIDIANELGYSKPSVSVAMKNLRENGYIEVMSDGNIVLLPPGEEIAVRLYERHRVLTEFFVRLGVSERTAEEDACKIEHILSGESYEAIRLEAERLNKTE